MPRHSQPAYLAEIKLYHQLLIEPLKGKPVGCDDNEILALERHVGFPLPLAYKQYLSFMGKDYNGVFVGSDWFITDVKENTERVPELLKENHIAFVLPENYLCFFSHQGYIAAWFDLTKTGDNPEVWFYGEGQGIDSPVIKGRFTEFLFQDLQGLTECYLRNQS